MLELFGMLDHLVGLLLRDLIAQVPGAKPLQVHMGATGRKSGWKKGTWIMRRFNKFAVALVLGLGTVSATALIAPSAHAHMGVRSDEHTSELQSLMRMPYAVFCLTKKNYINT